MIEINKLILTKNNCYKTGRKMTPKGVMYHSTGANNPKLSRYVGPDDGILGKNPYGNHWNQPKPGGRSVCVHAFIGKDKNGKVRIYQTLPWNHVGWHSGHGNKGSANTKGYIGFEICEDALNDKAYFDECINLANQLTAYLIKKYNIPINNKTIISHSEGHKLGIASNHGDIEHWARKFGVTMNDIRKEVQKLVNGNISSSPSKPNTPSTIKIGDKITVKKSATNYATGQPIANFVKGNTYTVSKVQSDRVLLKEITSWLNISDIEGNKPTSKPSTPSKPNITQIKIDGYWGPDTTRSLQRTLGGTVDGIISGQYKNSITNNISGVNFSTKTGSAVIRKLQNKIGVKSDGYIGPDTIKALQRYLKTPVDGKISRPSLMVKELQKRLNNGTF